MSHRNLLLTFALSLFTLTGCLAPTEESMSDDYEDFWETYDDDFAERVRGAGGATPVIPLEARTGPWTGNNQLGIAQPFDSDENNRQTILKLDEWGMPEVWSVMLGIEYGDDSLVALGSGFEVAAVLSPGVGGASQEVKIDWRQGAIISMPMNSLNVIAEYRNPYPNASVTVPDDLRLTVTLARGTVIHPSPTLGSYYELLQYNAIQDLQTERYEIPAFTSHVRVIQQDAYDEKLMSGDYYLEFWATNDPADTVGMGSIEIDPQAVFEGCPVPGAAKYVSVRNRSAVAGNVTFYYQFVIGL